MGVGRELVEVELVGARFGGLAEADLVGNDDAVTAGDTLHVAPQKFLPCSKTTVLPLAFPADTSM